MAGSDAPLTGPDFAQGVASGQVVEGQTLLGHFEGHAVLLARCGGEVFGVGAHCSHYGGPLSEGLVVGETVRCPWHHAAFNLRTGLPERPPALNALPCWGVEEERSVVRVTGRRATTWGASTLKTLAPGDHVPDSVVIIGAGAAGAYAAETLRREGYDGPVTIIDGGPSGPVDRPNLSKDYLAGTAPEGWIPLRSESDYAELGIELVLGRRVTAIDAPAKRIVLDDGSARTYDALLIATGADPVKLTFTDPGQPVHYLRSLGDSRAIIERAVDAESAVVLGASFIGLEVAAALRTRGLDVVVVGPESRPLERVLGVELGDFVRRLHEQHGVTFRLGQTATAITASGVTLQSGDTLPADLVVAGIGVRPSIDLASSAGISTDKGIVVDEYLECSVPGIYAAGDIARWPDVHSGRRIRVEHWVVAERQGQTAARNILGRRERFDAVPFFWSQHYDVGINYVGHAEAWDSVTVDGDPDAHDCAVTYRSGDRVLAVATIYRDQVSLEAELAMERAR